MTQHTAFTGLLVAAAVAGLAVRGEARPGYDQLTFKSSSEAVTFDVSVKRGNTPVMGLESDDFRVTDNGVLQAIESVSIESVPLDVTVFHDTSGSLGGRIDELRQDIAAIHDMLRADDRLRVLAVGNQRVVDVFGWSGASDDLDLRRIVEGSFSPINDAFVVALLHRPAVGRRHVVVALTDLLDNGSTLDARQVEEVARRSESLLHVIAVPASGAQGTSRPLWAPTGFEGQAALSILRGVAKLTGGEVHGRLVGAPNPVDEFGRILSDFRASYVLRYIPAGVKAPGWHEIRVQVPSIPRATIQARRGYYR